MEDNLYEFVFDESKMDGVFSISLVKDPAIDVEMFAFSKEATVWTLSDEEKRIVVSPVLIPNQKIYRKNIQGKEGYVFASEKTIEKLQQNFFKQKFNSNSLLHHTTPIKDIYFFESWLIENPDMDKSKALGFKDLPKGTWMVAAKIDNDEIWNDYIKTGEVRGLSMDAVLGVNKVENNKIIKFKKMNKKTITEVIRLAIESVAAAAELMEFKISDEVSYFATALEMEAIVMDADGNPVANAEFEFEGKVYSTDEMGAIKDIKEVSQEEETPAEEVAEPAQADEMLSEEDKKKEEMAEEVAPLAEPAPEEEAPAMPSETELKLAEAEARIAELEAMVAELEIKNANLEAEIVSKENTIVEFGKNTPATVGIVDRPTIENVKTSKSPLDIVRAALGK